jgi:hypothetical protein
MARAVAGDAPGGFELAVHVQHAPRARPLMKIVNILSDDQQLPRPFRVQPPQRPMRGIRLDVPQLLAARIVEFLNQKRIPAERLGSRDIFHPVPLPKSVGASERSKAALGRDAGPGEDEDVANVSHPSELMERERRWKDLSCVLHLTP